MAKQIYIKLSWKARIELFKLKYIDNDLWRWDYITRGKWYTFKKFLKDVWELFFPKKLGALFG